MFYVFIFLFSDFHVQGIWGTYRILNHRSLKAYHNILNLYRRAKNKEGDWNFPGNNFFDIYNKISTI